MSKTIDPYYEWLGIPPAEQPPNYYRLLGLPPFESQTNVIANAADRQMTFVRSFQSGPHASESQVLLNELSAARLTLLSPERKAAYDGQLRGRLQKQAGPSPSSVIRSAPAPSASSVSRPAPAPRPTPRPAEPEAPQVFVQDSGSSSRRRKSNGSWVGMAAVGVGIVVCVLFAIIFLQPSDTPVVATETTDSSQTQSTTPVGGSPTTTVGTEPNVPANSPPAVPSFRGTPTQTPTNVTQTTNPEEPAVANPMVDPNPSDPSQSDPNATQGGSTGEEPSGNPNRMPGPSTLPRRGLGSLVPLPNPPAGETPESPVSESPEPRVIAAPISVAGYSPERLTSLGMPDELKGGLVFVRDNDNSSNDVSQGAVEITVESECVVYLAPTWRFEGFPDASWGEEALSRDDLVRRGWKELGPCTWYDDNERFLYRRQVRAGEAFRVRTNKYSAPAVFVTPVPLAATPDSETPEKPKGPWIPLAENGFLTECFTLGPFPAAAVADAEVVTFLARRRANETLYDLSPVPAEAAMRSRDGTLVPTFVGPGASDTVMYYLFQIRVKGNQSVFVSPQTYDDWGYNTVHAAVDGVPVPNDTRLPLRNGVHTILVKQHHRRGDEADRSWVRLQILGTGIEQHIAEVEKPAEKDE